MRLLALALIALCVGCAGSGHVKKIEYLGDTHNWPTGTGGFGKRVDGVVIIESGLPDRPYSVIRLIDIPVKTTLDCPAAWRHLTEDAGAPACWDYFAVNEAKNANADGILVLNERVTSSQAFIQSFPTATGTAVLGSSRATTSKSALLIRYK